MVRTGEWAVRRVVGSGEAGSRDDPWGRGEASESENGGGDGDGGGSLPLLSASSSSPRSHECFFDHSPSPHACALSGGVWDDSEAATAEGAGGECLSDEEAERRLREAEDGAADEALLLSAMGSSSPPPPPPPLELVKIRVLSGQGAPPLRCLRWRDREGHHRAMRAFFGGRCAEEA